MADTPKHTPGPWHVMPSGFHVGDKKVWFDENNARRGETPNILIECPSEEDACLIAAAPELLEHGGKLAAEVAGLKAFEQDIRAVIGNTNWSVLIDRLVGVENALAKAEGHS